MAVSSAVPVRRLTVEDVIAMSVAGILDETSRVELIEGVLVEMNPVGARHSLLVTRLNMHFAPAVAGRFEVHVQDSLKTGAESFVMPDLAVAEPTADGELPRTALLVIEVAHTSHARDAEKAQTYAAAGVPEYWIVDAVGETVQVFKFPEGRSYRMVFDHAEGEVASALEGVPPLALAPFFAR